MLVGLLIIIDFDLQGTINVSITQQCHGDAYFGPAGVQVAIDVVTFPDDAPPSVFVETRNQQERIRLGKESLLVHKLICSEADDEVVAGGRQALGMNLDDTTVDFRETLGPVGNRDMLNQQLQ